MSLYDMLHSCSCSVVVNTPTQARGQAAGCPITGLPCRRPRRCAARPLPTRLARAAGCPGRGPGRCCPACLTCCAGAPRPRRPGSGCAAAAGPAHHQPPLCRRRATRMVCGVGCGRRERPRGRLHAWGWPAAARDGCAAAAAGAAVLKCRCLLESLEDERGSNQVRWVLGVAETEFQACGWHHTASQCTHLNQRSMHQPSAPASMPSPEKRLAPDGFAGGGPSADAPAPAATAADATASGRAFEGAPLVAGSRAGAAGSSVRGPPGSSVVLRALRPAGGGPGAHIIKLVTASAAHHNTGSTLVDGAAGQCNQVPCADRT